MEVQKYIKLIKILCVHTNFDGNVFFFLSISHIINEWTKGKIVLYINFKRLTKYFLPLHHQDNTQETHSSGILKSLCFVAKKWISFTHSSIASSSTLCHIVIKSVKIFFSPSNHYVFFFTYVSFKIYVTNNVNLVTIINAFIMIQRVNDYEQ